MAESGRVLADHRHLTAEWLTGALRDGGVLDRGRVASVRVERWRSKPLSELLRLQVTYSPGAPAAPASLVAKVSKPGPASRRAARRGWKENRFYTLVAPHMADPPVPVCYGAAHDPARGRSHLLIEDLSESHDRPPRGLPPTPEQAGQDVDCLAAVHGRWWNEPDLVRAVGLRDGRWYERRIAATADVHARFDAAVGPHLPAATRALLAEVAASHPALLRRHARAALTVAHGDAHCWNFLTPRASGGRPCLLDWECWDVEPGTKDLAALMALHWYPDLREALERPLLERYHRGLQAHGVEGYGWAACWTDYRFAVAERMLSPLYQWHRGRPVDAWWPNLARITAAYRDLGCAELLG
jgi:hypothetical protein